MGVSYAIWTSADGIIDGGNTSQSPSVTPDLENYVWAKYFQYRQYGENTTDIELTGFYYDGSNSYGINLSDVYFPSEIWVKNDGARINTIAEKEALKASEYTTYTVKSISNQVFMDTTLQELAVNIYIPSSVINVDDMTFANLHNLEYVYCLNDNELTIGNYAFIGCENLKAVYKVSTGTVTANENAFLGTAVEGVTSPQS